MSSYPYQGAAFLADYMDGPHLVVVMNDPDSDGLCLLVMVSTIYPDRKHDPACLLEGADHSFITRPSYVVYARANYALGRHIANMVDKKLYVPRDDITATVFQRIADGIFKSDNSAGSLIKYAEKQKI